MNRKLLCAALAVVLILSLAVGCGSGGSGSGSGATSSSSEAPAPKPTVVGEWTTDWNLSTLYYTFNADGTGELKDWYTFTYVYSEADGTLVLDIDTMDGNFEYKAKLDGDVLTLTDSFDADMILERK